ncbi:MAG: tRNA (guanosine(37)-N1)-methyltransferase TrmD [Actinomycetaceae bacterium]|nr:tRNA (guanosine(37)-N1)-methyltransferase TrmD [Actinomycetaceae bacterium]
MTRFDIISVFPEFFGALDLSIVGRARKRGIIDVRCHDLRDWTEDAHRTVDDTPIGGGAGMVMRPDIWGRALDDLVGADAVLAIPTPSGQPLTQRHCEDLARAGHIVIACGRYEGIDARVARHYEQRGVRVFEYSLGDYVLGGGEVAAIVLVEAVARLVPGVIGNPESLVEESHSEAGLLEYPVYTRPTSWREHAVDDVLTSGDHGKIRRWRRDRAIELTARRRPDMITRLKADALDRADRRKLAELGYLLPAGAAHPLPAVVRSAEPDDIPALTALAARTFPDACPKDMREEDMRAFVDDNLSASHFERYIADPGYLTLVLDAGGLGGYSLVYLPEGDGVSGVERGAPVDAVVDGRRRQGPMAELSKFYLDRGLRGTGARTLLWQATLSALQEWSAQWAEPYVWLGTNDANHRAANAYRALGFEFQGKRTFRVGEQDNVDKVFARPIRMA